MIYIPQPAAGGIRENRHCHLQSGDRIWNNSACWIRHNGQLIKFNFSTKRIIQIPSDRSRRERIILELSACSLVTRNNADTIIPLLVIYWDHRPLWVEKKFRLIWRKFWVQKKYLDIAPLNIKAWVWCSVLTTLKTKCLGGNRKLFMEMS
jgi:hypothetical protein